MRLNFINSSILIQYVVRPAVCPVKMAFNE